MSEHSKKMWRAVIRGLKYTASLLERALRGEEI
jgi:hypothetical protein